MAFYTTKGKTEDVFKIKQTIGLQSYSIWDNESKTFIRDGNITDFEGNEHDVKETKFIKAEEFKRLFPHKSKNNKVRWEVIVDGEEQTWDAPISVDQALSSCIANALAMGQDPLAIEYKWTKTGEGLKTRYAVSINSQNTPLPQVDVVIPTESSEPHIELNPTEKTIVDAIRQQGNGFTFDQVKETFLKYNIQEDKARLIFNQELK